MIEQPAFGARPMVNLVHLTLAELRFRVNARLKAIPSADHRRTSASPSTMTRCSLQFDQPGNLLGAKSLMAH
jgi:hypothetical protein